MLTPEETARWEQIKRDFLRSKAMGGDDADVGGRVVAQLADIAGGLQALGAAASAPPPEPPPAPEPERDDALPDAIRAAVAPLIEAIRASHDAMRTSHAQQREATDAMLRVISAARAEPTIVREVVHVTAAAAVPVAGAVEAIQPVAVAGQPIGVAGVTTAEPAHAAAPVAVTEAAEAVAPAAESVAVVEEPVATARPAEETRVEDTLHNLPIIGGDSKPLRVWPPKRGG